MMGNYHVRCGAGEKPEVATPEAYLSLYGDIYCASASAMFKVAVIKHGENSHLRQKGKIAELALRYGGSVGALKSMGAIEMGLQEEELKPLVDMWRQSNPHIVSYWWDVDRAVKTAILQASYSELTGMKHHFIKKIKIAAVPITRLVSPLSILVNYVVKEFLYYRLQLIHLINDCTLRLVKDFGNFLS